MELLSREQIKDMCQEALETAEQYGAEEALTFLIGEKFYEVLRELKKAENSIRFIYGGTPAAETPSDETPDRQSIRVNYALTLNQNYKNQIHKVKVLEKIRDIFIHEIKDAFEVMDIQDYLGTYPRLGPKRSAPYRDWPGAAEKVSSFSAEEVLAEADDVFFVEEMKKLFSSR